MDADRLGKYEIQSTLGRGAMGTVYAGWDPIISRKVAIKTVRLPDAADIDAQEELARFKREAQAAGRLAHPNIVGVFDYGETDQVAFIVMEFVDGHTLKSLLDAGDRMPVATVGRVMADLLAGLRYSHERGVIHRDIKPANIMITGGDGHGSGQAKIADFGIARIESSNMTQAGTIMGTPAYMSPEQFMGQTVDARTDLYSAGVLLFQLLTGERPFEGSMATIMHRALNTVPPKPSDLSVTAPVSFDAVVARAMARRPEDRFATAEAFAEALQVALAAPASGGLRIGLGDGFGDDATVIAAPPRPAIAPAPKAAPPSESRFPVIAAAVVVLLALAGGGAWFALSGPSGTVRTADAGPVVAPPDPSVTKVGPPEVAPVVAQIVPPVAPPPISLPPAPAPPPANPVTPTPIPPPLPPPTTPAPLPPVTQVTPPVAAPPVAAPPVAAPPVAAPPVAAPPVSQAPAAAPPEPPVVPSSAPIPVVPPELRPQAAVAMTPEALRRAVAAAVAGADCAVVAGEVARQGGTVTLRGVIGQGKPEQDVRRAIRDAAPTATIDWGLGVAEGPYCGALNLVRAYARPFGEPGGVQLGLKDGRTSLLADERVQIRTTLSDFPAYVQIDYLMNDGTVAHLQKSAAGSATAPARSVTELFGGEVGPPFGTDLVLAIASSAPLFAKEQVLSETAEDYLRALRAALEQAGRGKARLAAGALLVRTSPRP